MKSKTIHKRFFPLFLSLMLAFSSPGQIFATQITDSQESEAIYQPEQEITPGQPVLLSANDITDGTKETSDSNDDITETTAEPEVSILPETEGQSITINIYDTDGTTLFYGPIIKDMSAIANPSNGRFLFDTITENGESAYDSTQFANLPYIRRGRILKWKRSSNTSTYSAESLLTKAKFKVTEDVTALPNVKPYDYKLEFDPDGGEYDFDREESTSVPGRFNVESDPITLPRVYKKGYTFVGWQITNPDAQAAYGQVITAIPTGTCIDYNCDVLFPTGETSAFLGYQLKAMFEPIVTQIPSVASVKNSKKGEIKVSVAANSAETTGIGFELSYSNKNNFKKDNTHVVDLKQKTGYTITNAPKGKTYYFRVRAYKTDEKGALIYSDYSEVKSLKITQGVTETKKITKNSAALTAANVMIDADKNLYVKATAKNRLKSYDDFYYLVSIDPDTGKILRAVANSDKNKTVIFKTPVRDENGVNLINGKYALAVKSSKKQYKQISSAFFIKNPEAAADYTGAYPVTKSKKGIQGNTNTELGVQQTFYNFDLNNILATSSYGQKYVYNGKTYYFSPPSGLVHSVSTCNKMGITCSVQIMMSWPVNGKYKSLLFGTKSKASPTNWYAINASTPQSRELVEAAFSFLAEYLANEDCHIDNWILGNEVNIHPQWYYAGNTGSEAFMKNYANTFRILYNSVKGRSKNSRVFICTDHTWKNRCGDWGAKPFMDSFDSKIKAMNKNIQWNLAYHAYPSILYIPSTWNDSYTTNNLGTDFVSPKNLNVLTDYVKKTYGKNTRIIISECGFTNANGESIQAAALAYSFYKAQFNDMIDAFIIRTEKDAPGETLRRLDGVTIDAEFGLVSGTGKMRESYYVFKYMDTPQYAKYTNKYLKTIGASGWKNIIPGFKDSTLKKMPNRK